MRMALLLPPPLWGRGREAVAHACPIARPPPQPLPTRGRGEEASPCHVRDAVIALLHSSYFSTSPAAILRACLRGAPSSPSPPRSKASSVSIRSASRGCLSQRSRLMRG